MPARRSPERPTELAPAIDLGGSRVLVGTCSWTDRTLVNESDQYPRWFTPKDSNREELTAARRRLPDFDLCVEFRNGRWLADDEADRTFEFLESQNLAYVCVDEPQGFDSSLPPVVAVTSDLAVVRFHGRNAETWTADVPSASFRFRSRYEPAELEEWLPRIEELAGSAQEIHVLMNNCYRDHAVDNASEIARLLRGEPALEEQSEQQTLDIG